jgi:hypothetical protein
MERKCRHVMLSRRRKTEESNEECVESDRQKPKLKHDADKKKRRPQGKHPHKAKYVTQGVS